MTVLLDRVRDLVKEESFDQALALCDEALSSESEQDRSHLWALRSYVHRAMDRFELAVGDASAGLAERPRSLSLLLERAINCIDLHRYMEANSDLEQLLLVEREQCESFFEVTASILRVICLNRLGQPQEALTVCQALPWEARAWALDRLWSRAELEEESRALLSDV
jgi:tetratricopeptide (TPR) repeat protein